MSVQNPTQDEVKYAIQAFLDYGESSFRPQHRRLDSGHRGYFSGCGWPATILQNYLKNLENTVDSLDK